MKVAKLDAQGKKGGIYGGAFLMGDGLAAERAAAKIWRLSPRERALVDQLKPLGERPKPPQGGFFFFLGVPEKKWFTSPDVYSKL